MDGALVKFNRAASFFKKFDDQETKKNAIEHYLRKIFKDDLVFLQGDAGDSLYVILQRSIGLFKMWTDNC